MPNGTWVLGDLFTKDYGHAGSIAKPWEKRWKFPCKLGVYPFHDGKFEDFEPIFDYLVANNIINPYDDEYTRDFEDMKDKCRDEFGLVSGKGPGVAVVAEGRPSCKILLINGVLDGCMPVEDSMLLAEYGRPKEMRFIRERVHMGYPEANGIVYPWMEDVLRGT